MKWAFILFIATAVVSYLAKSLVEKGKIEYLYARKIVHLFAIGLAAISTYIIDAELLFWLVAILTSVLLVLVLAGFFNLKNKETNDWGLFYFSFAYLLLSGLFPGRDQLIFYPMAVLAFSDGFATIVGYCLGKHYYTTGGGTKSIEGSLTFFGFTFVILFVLPLLIPLLSLPFHSVYAVIVVSVFLTCLEAISTKGRDNLWIPLGLAYWICVESHFIDQWYFLIFIAVGGAVFIAHKLRWLSSDGALATALLGWFLVISPYPLCILPFLFFFVVGSLLSKLPSGKRRMPSGVRSAIQVFSNGGFAAILLGFYFTTSNFTFFVAGMSALAVAFSDTVSSEIGGRRGVKTIHILTGRLVEPGLSGGVSVIGFLSGIAATVLFASFVLIIFDSVDWKIGLIIAGIGFLGNIIDSLLGALLQVKYRENETKPWSDLPSNTGQNERRGISFITNDRVNLITTAIGGILGVLASVFL